METQVLLSAAVSLLLLLLGLLLLQRCSSSQRAANPEELEGFEGKNGEVERQMKKLKHKKQKPNFKSNAHPPEAPKHSLDPQQTPNFRENELFVDFVKGVNKPVDCIAVAPHAPLIAAATADGKVHVALDGGSTYFLNFREDTFSAIDFWSKEKQNQNSAFLAAAMATEGRMVCFEVKIENKKVTGMKEIHRSKHPLQKGVVAQLISGKGPWVVSRGDGDDTELRVHSYEGDLLASVDTKQVHNLQLSVSGDGCLFGCAAWAPGVKIFEVKAKGGNFQKLEKAMDVKSSSGLIAFCISEDSKRAAVVNKGGGVSLWRLDVRHQAGEDTKKITETTVPLESSGRTTLHFSRDGEIIIVATGSTLHFFRAAELQLFKTVEHVTSQPIESLIVAPNNKFILLSSKGLRPVILRLPQYS